MKYNHALVRASLLFFTSVPSLGWLDRSVNTPVLNADKFERQVLDAHNFERQEFGAAPLAWDEELTQAADEYAMQLAHNDHWSHAPADQRIGQGENLWKGTRGQFAAGRMVARWAYGKQLFQPGKFPHVSQSGNWADVAHYTQVVWPATRRVGCSVRSSERWDYLVCRYSQPGNRVGERLAPSRFASLASRFTYSSRSSGGSRAPSAR